MHIVRFGKPEEFYLENQWKTARGAVFLENSGIPGIPDESNLFKGLFYGK